MGADRLGTAVLYTRSRSMAVLASPWSTPAPKGVGVDATPVSLYPVPIVYYADGRGLPNTRSVRSHCMTLPLPSSHRVAVEHLSALSGALKASYCLMVAHSIHHQRDINALQWDTGGGDFGATSPEIYLSIFPVL